MSVLPRPGDASDRDTWRALVRDGELAGFGESENIVCARRLKGHASTRRFYRVWGAAPGAWILVLYPEGQDTEMDRYERTATWLRSAGVRVPAVRARAGRALLVEDGGASLLDDAVARGAPTGRAYRQAVDVIVRLQRYGQRHEGPNPEWALDRARLRRELAFTEQHAVQGWLGRERGAEARGRIFDRLADLVAAIPRAICHRDFHSRNLLASRDRLMVLDFQDTMAGPFLYDLASLLWDDYCDLSHPQRTAALAQFWSEHGRNLRPAAGERLPEAPAGLPSAARQAICLVGLQRSLKALGTFGYQVTVAGNADYARAAPRTWQHVRRRLRLLGWDDLGSLLSAFDRIDGVT